MNPVHYISCVILLLLYGSLLAQNGNTQVFKIQKTKGKNLDSVARVVYDTIEWSQACNSGIGQILKLPSKYSLESSQWVINIADGGEIMGLWADIRCLGQSGSKITISDIFVSKRKKKIKLPDKVVVIR